MVLDRQGREFCIQAWQDLKEVLRPHQFLRNTLEFPKVLRQTLPGVGLLVLVVVMAALEFVYLTAAPVIGAGILGYVIFCLLQHPGRCEHQGSTCESFEEA